jgi:hypothetical protein
MRNDERTTEYESMSKPYTYAFMTCVLILAGCAPQQRQTPTGQIHVPDIGKAETMKAAEQVLAEMHFPIEKADVESGYIRTRPLPGAQFFEFWRSDNVGAENSIQANLHTIRRTVELDVSRRGSQVRIGCNVRVQRLSLPERDVSSSARAYGMFTRSSPSLQKLKFDDTQKKGMAWIDLANDILLAEEILRRIEKQIEEGNLPASARPGDESQPAENET